MFPRLFSMMGLLQQPRQFSVSVRTLTVLAIKVISVKRLLGFINYTAFKKINKEV